MKRDGRHYQGILAPRTPPEEDAGGALGPVTPEGRLLYAIVAGLANAAVAVILAMVTGAAVAFAGFGSGRGWEPVALISLVAWLGGLSTVLAITRNGFLGQRLPIGSAVTVCLLATVVTFAVTMRLGLGALATFVALAVVSSAVVYAISRRG